MNIDVNYLGIFLAAVASTITGFLWYSPLVLGKPWMKERKFTEKSMKEAQKTMGKLYGLSFLASLVTAFVLSHTSSLSQNFYQYTFLSSAVTTAFWMWVGFVMPVQLTATIFSDNKNWKLFGIDTGYQLASLLVMGVVLGIL